jgi:hypothetical protein
MLSNSVTIKEAAMLMTEKNEKLFEKKAKKQIQVGTWEYRQIQDCRKRESGWEKALIFYFTSLSTKKKIYPSN